MAESNLFTQDPYYPYSLEDSANDVKDAVVIDKQSWLKLRKIEFYEKLDYLFHSFALPSTANSTNVPKTGQRRRKTASSNISNPQTCTESVQTRYSKFEAAVEVFFTPRFFTDERYQDLLSTIDYQKRVISKLSVVCDHNSPDENKKCILAAVLIKIEAITQCNNG